MRASLSLPAFSGLRLGRAPRPLGPTPARLPRRLYSQPRLALRVTAGRRRYQGSRPKPWNRTRAWKIRTPREVGRRGAASRGRWGARGAARGGERGNEEMHCFENASKKERPEGRSGEEPRTPTRRCGRSRYKVPGSELWTEEEGRLEGGKGKIRASSHLSQRSSLKTLPLNRVKQGLIVL